jgi:hypothetical protein
VTVVVDAWISTDARGSGSPVAPSPRPFAIERPRVAGSPDNPLVAVRAEEGRHARELGELLRALGGQRLREYSGEALFRRARNMFGLRAKMQVLTAAEVIGLVFYGLIVEHVDEPTIRRTLGLMAGEEARHLEFQRQWFARVIALCPAPLRPFYAAALAVRFAAILTASMTAATWAQRSLLRALRVSPITVGLRAIEAMLSP